MDIMAYDVGQFEKGKHKLISISSLECARRGEGILGPYTLIGTLSRGLLAARVERTASDGSKAKGHGSPKKEERR
jgi:hypothetical protein